MVYRRTHQVVKRLAARRSAILAAARLIGLALLDATFMLSAPNEITYCRICAAPYALGEFMNIAAGRESSFLCTGNDDGS